MIRHWTSRIANGACLASAMLWVFSLSVTFLTFALNPWGNHLTINPDFRVGVWSGFSLDLVLGFSGTDPVLVFFNRNEGPYRGSLITVEGDPHPPVVTGVDWEFPRIYYRHIRWDDSLTWTLMVSLWYPLILFAIGPLIWGVSRWRHSHAKVEPKPDQSAGNA
ncbi:MAG: hypothetical protein AABP62_10725 [Planctomycetota bacterium]